MLLTIKFKTFQDYFVKFKDFKALNLVQSNSRLFMTFKAPYGPCLCIHAPIIKCFCSSTKTVLVNGSVVSETLTDFSSDNSLIQCVTVETEICHTWNVI